MSSDDDGPGGLFGGLFGRPRGGPFSRWSGRRVFDHGALRLLVLGLLGEEPRHGYEIIKLLKDRFQGSYSPSPGSIYPILAGLAEAGMVEAQIEGTRKLFTLTTEGRAWLEQQRPEFEAIMAQLEATAAPIGQSDLGATIIAFRRTLFTKMRRGALDGAQAIRLREILERARREIEAL
jgi:DNA-binding PadR family transcriptional regulator